MDYLNRLPHDATFRALRQRLERPGAREVVGGVVAGALPLLAAALRRALGRPVVVLVRTAEEADLFALDAEAFSHEPVILFESPGVPAFKPVSPPLEVSARRVKALEGFAEGGWGVAAWDAARRRLPPPAVLREGTFQLRPGDTIDLPAAASRLVAMGYRRVATVEGPGQFSVRGAVVDVYPPAADPCRCELAGDVVETLVCLDVWTQRRTRPLDGVTLAPVREVVVTPAGLERAVAAVRGRYGADIAADFYESLDLHRHCDGVENLLPFFFETTALLCDYPPPSALWILYDLDDEPLPPAGPPPFPLPEELFVTLDDFVSPRRVGEGGVLEVRAAPLEGGLNFETRPVSHVTSHPEVFVTEALSLTEAGCDVVVALDNPRHVERLREVSGGVDLPVHFDFRPAGRGFIWKDAGWAVFPGALILDRRPAGRRRKPPRFAPGDDARALTSPFDLSPGELVVHVDHGVGRFDGLVTLPVGGVEEELIALTYAGEDRLYVPVQNLGAVYKYVGGDPQRKPLDRIGGAEWKRARRRARRSAEKLAQQLVELYAARAVREGYAFAGDPAWEEELADTFPYVETPDQARAVAEVLADMADSKPMDRLICGDVGFGKTEVAVRAAARACADGKQVAVLVPTTVLADQHYATFKERLGPFPLRVELVSRFRSPQEQRAVIADVREGKVDVVVGTHRLLSADVAFRDLGLLIVDEEQHFGVRHKEKIKELRATVDVLTLSATPIPRTLHMALAGLRDMSLIGTAPLERLPIQTVVAPFDEDLIIGAVRRELARGGQVFFVHNRVRTISALASYLGNLVPEARFGVAHGQLPERELERIMHDFARKRYDVLVSSAIIEAGLDFPNCNTIIVNRADTFGLSQLHQLRGRVGRSHVRAYAYFLTPPSHSLTDQTRERLQALKENTELGSGFRLALRDLEIRGAGNLLGPEQSGAVAAVGLDLYTRLLSAAVARLRGEEEEPSVDANAVTIRFSVPARLPAWYVEDERQRLKLYRRLAEARSEEEIAAVGEELRDRYGALPPEAERLLAARRIRVLAAPAGVAVVHVRDRSLGWEFCDERFRRVSGVVVPDEVEEVSLRKRGERYAVEMRLVPGADPVAAAVEVARRMGTAP